MAIWIVRAGKGGEREELALDEGLAVVGWSELPDLSGLKSRQELEELCNKTYPDAKTNTIGNWVAQLWAFRDRIRLDDLVALPLKTRAAIAIGKVVGPYEFRPDLPPDAHHTRRVEWIRKDIPRTAFEQDLLYSLGAAQTVCQVSRNRAEERIRAVLEGKTKPPTPPNPTPNGDGEDLDLQQYALDQIRDYIGRKFRGHELSRLVTAVLKAQGYQTQMAPPGADGGVDIIAGRGPMGFDGPRLCVQVKSSDQPVDVGTLRELQGVLRHFGAQQGLFVAWGGFKHSVLNEARRLFFEIRLWDSGDLINALLDSYERLPADLQTELPLQRTWTLVIEE